jgi:hypothetical protein
MLKHICKDGNKQISKREKKERKSALRIVLDYLVDQISPYESISMTGADVEMESFQKILIFPPILKSSSNILLIENVDPARVSVYSCDLTALTNLSYNHHHLFRKY